MELERVTILEGVWMEIAAQTKPPATIRRKCSPGSIFKRWETLAVTEKYKSFTLWLVTFRLFIES